METTQCQSDWQCVKTTLKGAAGGGYRGRVQVVGVSEKQGAQVMRESSLGFFFGVSGVHCALTFEWGFSLLFIYFSPFYKDKVRHWRTLEKKNSRYS
jgi:hypothetical protein